MNKRIEEIVISNCRDMVTPDLYGCIEELETYCKAREKVAYQKGWEDTFDYVSGYCGHVDIYDDFGIYEGNVKISDLMETYLQQEKEGE